MAAQLVGLGCIVAVPRVAPTATTAWNFFSCDFDDIPTKVRRALAQELFRTRRSHATDGLIARIHGWIEFQLVAIHNCSFS